jgi:hypothetical protein
MPTPAKQAMTELRKFVRECVKMEWLAAVRKPELIARLVVDLDRDLVVKALAHIIEQEVNNVILDEFLRRELEHDPAARPHLEDGYIQNLAEAGQLPLWYLLRMGPRALKFLRAAQLILDTRREEMLARIEELKARPFEPESPRSQIEQVLAEPLLRALRSQRN